MLSMTGTLNKSKMEKNHPKRDKMSEDGASKTCDVLRLEYIRIGPEYSGLSGIIWTQSEQIPKCPNKNSSIKVLDFIRNGPKFSGRSGMDPDYSGSIPGDSGRPVSG